jgi:O-antigen/teichoic acid export membrane protein
MQLFTTALLARLLAPDDFGLVAIAMVIITLLTLVEHLGTGAALVQRAELTPTLQSTLFWFNTFVAGILAFALVFSAPLLAFFFQEPALTEILRVLALSILLVGLSIVHRAILKRRMAFKSLAYIDISSIAVGAVTGISAALAGLEAWSLVYQTIAISSTATILLWYFSKWRPTFIFSWNDLKSVAKYSLNLSVAQLFSYLIRNADYLLIGKFLGSHALGFYTLGYKFLLYPLQNISGVINKVLFPAYSRLQNDDARFRQAYLQAVGGIAFAVFPMMLGLFIVAEPLVLFVLGERWEPIIPLVMIFSVMGIWQSVNTNVGNIYMAKGRTDWMMRWTVFASIITVTAFIIGLRWGVIGVAMAYAVANFCLAYPASAIPFRLIGLPYIELLRAVSRPLMASVFMAAGTGALRETLLNGLPLLWELALSIACGVILYFAGTLLFNRHQPSTLLAMLRNQKEATAQPSD